MTAPRRIGHVLNTLGLGGVPEAAWHLAKHLREQSFDVSVFVLREAEGEDAARGQRLASFNAIGAPVTVCTAGAVKPLRAAGALAAWVESERIEILHTHSYRPNLVARMAALPLRSSGLRIVAHYHNRYDNKWAQDGTLALDRALALQTDSVVACSHAVAVHVEERLRLAAGSVRVIRNGVDTSRFLPMDRARARAALEMPADVPVVGIVGRLCEQKGQDRFIDAAAQVHRARPNVRFIVVGAPDEPATGTRLLAQAQAAGLAEPTLRFLGHRGDMPTVYAALDLLVAPSRWEGFGLMLVEAMACATPIVATEVDGIPEVVGNGSAARLVPNGDATALVQAMLALLDEPIERERMRQAGLARTQQFGWIDSARALAELYRLLPR
jgi:glycosyltransferase involved in cell wall biosynthesis